MQRGGGLKKEKIAELPKDEPLVISAFCFLNIFGGKAFWGEKPASIYKNMESYQRHFYTPQKLFLQYGGGEL